MIHYIYRIVNSVNNKSYIGYTSRTNPTDRWKTHLVTAKWCNRPLYRAMRKYGIGAFTFVVIYCSLNGSHTLSTMENYFIQEYHSHITDNGYNLTLGGESNIGWVPSTATRRLWSLQRSGRKLSADRTKQMSDITRQRYIDNPTLRQVARERAIIRGTRPPLPTAETHRKSGETRRGRHIHSDNYKKQLSVAVNDPDHPFHSLPAMNKRKQSWKESNRGIGDKNGNAVFCVVIDSNNAHVGKGFLKKLCDDYNLPFAKFLAASRHGNALQRGEWKGWRITRYQP